MYVYLITNLINNKQYVGITNDYKKRWSNEKMGYKAKRPQVITNAIGKYGKENFKFELLYRGLTVEEAIQKEKELVQFYNCQVPNGYNVDPGGNYHPSFSPMHGEKNGMALLTDEEAQYIKDHRYKPMYELYEEFNNKISYEQFKKCYNHQTYTHLTPHANPYPYNFEFACQFNGGNLEYDEVLDIRERYGKGEYWKKVYEDYKDKFQNEMSFWNTYTGRNYKLVMPEVFTEENKKIHASLKRSGSNNSHAKLSAEDVKKIRQLHDEGVTNSELYKLYPQVSTTTIRDIIKFKTWKNVI